MIDQSLKYFQEFLSPLYKPKYIEDKVRTYWQKENIKKIVAEQLKDKPHVGYVEGPPTLNGEPHIGHIRGRIIKDLWYRQLVLKGFNVVFRAGWDTQGLPVELQAEKELGLMGNKAENIKAVGEEAIIRACKDLINKYYKLWRESDELLGMSMDYDKAYWTFKDDYIEREWKYLEKAWKKGLLGEGYRVVAYCPSCQTSLSHSEVVQGYRLVVDPSLHFKMKLSEEDAYLILWTTMPFTIVTDQMVAVKPDANYTYVKVGNEIWIVGEKRLVSLMDELGISDYEVLKVIKGYKLEGKKYLHPLMDLIPKQLILDKESYVHTIIAEDFVDVDTGSGLVHLSPANGEEDFHASIKRNMPVFNPIDDRAYFTHEAGVFDGMYLRDADEKVIDLLKEREMILKVNKISHEYPTCWRSQHKLVWIARREYFYWVDKLEDLAIRAAEGIKYYYNPPKNRFIDIINEKVPWCISRERIWGAPLPIWVCEGCKKKIPAFSREEIVNKALELPYGRNFELHRPWLDKILLECPDCGSKAYREPFVLDTWHNSGASPYASFTDKEYKDLVPVEFLTEGIDQTRGWAYTLLIEHIILTERAEAPYKAFLFTGHVLDEKGRKMSKSLGNVIDALDILKSSSVDVLRFYLIWRNSPLDTLNFSISEMDSRPYQVLSTLYYMHIYFQQNSSYDGYNQADNTLDWALKNKLLKPHELWLLSNLQNLIANVSNGYKNCRYNESAKEIENFVIEILSQRYIPMTRSEIWDDSKETLNRRLAIYATLEKVLITLDVLFHPISPYLTEFLYQTLYAKSMRQKPTILLESWPRSNLDFVDKELELEFELLANLISLSNTARMKGRLKRRWPLRKAVFVIPKEKISKVEKHKEILRDQINVKEMLLTSSLNKAKIILNIQPKYAALGPKLKNRMSILSSLLKASDPLEIYNQLNDKGFIMKRIDNEDFKLMKDELSISYTSDEKYIVLEKDGLIISLDVERDSDLIIKGVIRDLARRMQNLRKERGYNPTDIIEGAYVVCLDPELKKQIISRSSDLTFLVRVKNVHISEKPYEGVNWVDVEIDGRRIKISVE
ncbi:MAG: isoleucine--tRNA ligase [Candidatus Methylarchaceae archaeon HK02M2]|nr:isoleucine--tRNA ligase [Candidatus Methylarchaceae archaeon HK02M2]